MIFLRSFENVGPDELIIHCGIWSVVCVQWRCVGGRFKKEVIVDGVSYLLLIRDEGSPPDMQV